MNYNLAINEIDQILKEMSKVINEHWAGEVLDTFEENIYSTINNIYRQESNTDYQRWRGQYNETKVGYRHKVDIKYHQWAKFLHLIKTDLEQKKRLAVQKGEDVATLKQLLTDKETDISALKKRVEILENRFSYKFPFFLAILISVSSWIWMIPILFEVGNWGWQFAGQVFVTLIWAAVYKNFNWKELVSKEVIITVVGGIVSGLVVAFLASKLAWV